MATRSTIAIRNADGTVTGIYCHWDGYFSYNGAILRDHYTDEAMVRELLSLGHISSLGEKIHPDTDAPHTFEKAQKGVCVFYGRDRGEEDQSAELFGSWNDLLNKQGQEYNYLFEPKDNCWYVEYYGERGALIEEMARETA